MNEEEEVSANSLAVVSIKRYLEENVEMFRAEEISNDIDTLTDSSSTSEGVDTDILVDIVELVLEEQVFTDSDSGKTDMNQLNDMLANTNVRVAPNKNFDEVVRVQYRTRYAY